MTSKNIEKQFAKNNLEKNLLVDDDPSLLRLLGIRLSAAGYQIESANSAKMALGILKSFDPQLVISDLRMEGMDGMDPIINSLSILCLESISFESISFDSISLFLLGFYFSVFVFAFVL